MSNPLKKTMVFLGLAEEELEEQESHASQGGQTASAQRDKPASAQAAETPRPQQRASVTPLRRVTPTKTQVQQPMSEILTVHPGEYKDAKVIAESFRDGVPVIINLSRMEESEAKRLIDFASGLTMGLHGKIERVTSKVFLLSPEHIEVGGADETSKNDSGSFFVAPSA